MNEWNVTPKQAIAIQNNLREKVLLEPLDIDSIATVGGCDISFDRGSNIVFAGFVVLDLKSLEVIERSGTETISTFPYIPGLLSFREIPPLLEAWETLRCKPDAIIADGHGIAHPRRFGIACHLGVTLDIPTIDSAKSRLVGTYEPAGARQGDWQPIIDKEDVIGAVLRLKTGVSPIFVSPGHRTDLRTSIELALRCAGPTRVPETTRHAHLFVNSLRRASTERYVQTSTMDTGAAENR